MKNERKQMPDKPTKLPPPPQSSAGPVERLVMRFMVVQNTISADNTNIDTTILFVDAVNRNEAMGIFMDKRDPIRARHFALPVAAFPLEDVKVLAA